MIASGHTRAVTSYDAVDGLSFNAVNYVVAQPRYAMTIQKNLYLGLSKPQQRDATQDMHGQLRSQRTPVSTPRIC